METKSKTSPYAILLVVALALATAGYYLTLKAEDACARLADARLDYQVRHVRASADYVNYQIDMALATNIAPEIRGQYRTDMRIAYHAISMTNKEALSAIQHRIDRLTAETANYPCR